MTAFEERVDNLIHYMERAERTMRRQGVDGRASR
jgi:hypothetical protein